jgi:hypothetical protein
MTVSASAGAPCTTDRGQPCGLVHSGTLKCNGSSICSSILHQQHVLNVDQPCVQLWPAACRNPAPTSGAVGAFPPLQLSSAANLPLKRQVFISHTGQDEDAKTFSASILKPAMEAAGLAVFMDFSNLEMGSKWPQELVDAAANSMVVVVVLSRSFTGRFWCMLELDLALHAHQRKQGIMNSSRQPLVLPVFYDCVDTIVDVDAIRQRWSGGLQRRLWRDEELGREWVVSVDVDRWVENIVTLKEELQHMRRSQGSQAFTKDEDWQLARGVVRVAARHMPCLVAVGGVVGFEEQEAALAAQLGGRLGLWLYGQGGWCRQGGTKCEHVGSHKWSPCRFFINCLCRKVCTNSQQAASCMLRYPTCRHHLAPVTTYNIGAD